jgi:pantoate--beta-alanine ligase
VKLVKTISEVREEVGRARSSGRSIGLVPTMGFLHEGHLSLIDRCRELSSYVAISIYVNPLQFGPSEDFDQYPRALESDLALTEERGVDLVFAPDDHELYPSEPAVTVTPRRLADRLCGLSRPGHFEGVLTVVSKLFGIVQPDLGVFGQKDFQQAVLIRKMVTDLDMPVQISRNEYLSAEERRRALSISRGLAGAVRSFGSGERDAAAIRQGVLGTLEAAGGVDVEYVEVVSADELEPVAQADENTVVAVAARVGDSRLIDNARLGAPDPGLAKLS